MIDIKNKKNLITWAIAVGVCLVIILILIIFSGAEKVYEKQFNFRNIKAVTTAAPAIRLGQLSGAVQLVRPAIVSICTVGVGMDNSLDMQGIATGIIINPEGYVLTSSLWITKSNDVKVVHYESTSLEGAAFEQGHNHIYDAQLLSVFPNIGLAIFRIVGNNLPSAVLGNSNLAQMGDWCMAIGSPFGQKPVVTSGIISAVNQTKNINGIAYRNLMETSCKGQYTGGPIINNQGEVIGIIIDQDAVVPSNQANMLLQNTGIENFNN